MFFIADIGFFLYMLCGENAYLCIKGTNLLLFLQCLIVAFYKMKRRCSPEMLTGLFASFWKPGNSVTCCCVEGQEELFFTATRHWCIVHIQLWQVCQTSSTAASSRAAGLQWCNNIIVSIADLFSPCGKSDKKQVLWWETLRRIEYLVSIYSEWRCTWYIVATVGN